MQIAVNQPSFIDFLNASHFVLMDGGNGSTHPDIAEEENHPLVMDLSSWSGKTNLTHSDIVRKTHQRFVDSGAILIGTNTFHTHTHFMERVLIEHTEEAERLLQACRAEYPEINRPDYTSKGDELAFWATKYAVDAAHAVTPHPDRPLYIFGSYGMIGDAHSYNAFKAFKDHPAHYLQKEYRRHAERLVSLGIEYLIPETASRLRDLVLMGEAAAETGKPFIISMTLNDNGLLFDGTTLKEAVGAIASLPGIVGITLNCTPIEVIDCALPKLLTLYDGSVGAYPNGGGHPHRGGVLWCHDHHPDTVRRASETLVRWSGLDSRVKFPGFCCGGSPKYTEATRRILDTKHPGQRLIEKRFAGNGSKTFAVA